MDDRKKIMQELADQAQELGMGYNSVKYPNIHVQLTGEDGNAFFIMARAGKALREGKVEKPEIDRFIQECMSGDYDHLLQTVMKWVNTS